MTEGPYGPQGPSSAQGGGEGASTRTQVQTKVQESARQVTGQVQEKTQEARQQASGRVREQVDQRSTQAGEQVRSTAEALRSTAQQLRDQGQEPQANVAEQAAERAERFGGYLVESDSDRILRDVEDFARRRPWAVGGGSVLVGFVVSRLLKASSSRRYEAESRGVSWTAPARPGMTRPPGRPLAEEVDVPPTPVAPLSSGAPAGRPVGTPEVDVAPGPVSPTAPGGRDAL